MKKIFLAAAIFLIAAGCSAQAPVSEKVNYQNSNYGFNFSLPNSWKGYTILTDQWSGVNNTNKGEVVVTTGPKISIRNPQWTEQKPWQDIPILVFTLDQWNNLQQDKFHIGAAPIGPRELGRNAKYVFALPARYNFADPIGVAEVEKIINGKALQAY
jgi:hypothetical protein